MQVALISGSVLLRQGLEGALAGLPGLRLQAVAAVSAVSALPLPALAVAPVADAAAGLALQRALPLALPLVLIGPALRDAGLPRALALLAPEAAADTLRAAVLAVAAGLRVQDASHARAAHAADDEVAEPLTPRELEVFELLAKGLSNRDIGQALGVSAHTAKFHVGQILAKTGSATRAEAVHAGLRRGLIGV